jgi:hypothetical protein
VKNFYLSIIKQISKVKSNIWEQKDNFAINVKKMINSHEMIYNYNFYLIN